MSERKIVGLMKVLMKLSYEDCPIYIRRIGSNIFIWDVIYENEIYSSFFDIKPRKGEKEMRESDVNEVIKMCYAGAATTIDMKKGKKLTKSEDEMVKLFDQALVTLEKNTVKANGKAN